MWGRLLGFEREEVLELAHELLDILKLSVDRGKADVGYWIEGVQLLHDALADFAGWDLTLELLREFSLQLIDELLKIVHADGTFLARLDKAGEELVSVKRFAAAVFFDDHERLLFDVLVRRESLAAAQTLSPSTDRYTVGTGARIDDLILLVAAERTFHECALATGGPLCFVSIF